MSQLKPCPFCGSEKVSFIEAEEQPMENTVIGFIYCHGCGFSSDSFYSKQQAAEKWNRRAHDKPSKYFPNCGAKMEEKKIVKRFCPMEHCRFRHGDRPCLFYFEYEDGKATCANASERARFDRNQRLKEAIDAVKGKE